MARVAADSAGWSASSSSRRKARKPPQARQKRIATLDSVKLLRRLIVGFLLLVAALFIGALLLPRTAHVERSIVIERPVATVFTVLNGFAHFARWSPWSELDPGMRITRSGPMHGPGARYAWESEEASVGSGTQEIVESVPYENVGVALTFSGMDAQARADYLLETLEDGTRVTWSHDVTFTDSLLSRYFGLMLERWVGADYERGLSKLKTFVETLPETDFSGLAVEQTQVSAQPIAYLSGVAGTESEAIAKAYETAFTRVRAAMQRDGLKPVGPPLVIGRHWDADANRYEFDAAFPVSPRATRLRADREVKLGQTYAGSVLKTIHRGPYSDLAAHFAQLMAYKRAMGYEENGAPWDVYVSDPERTPNEDLVTETYVPVK